MISKTWNRYPLVTTCDVVAKLPANRLLDSWIRLRVNMLCYMLLQHATWNGYMVVNLSMLMDGWLSFFKPKPLKPGPLKSENNIYRRIPDHLPIPSKNPQTTNPKIYDLIISLNRIVE